VQLHKLAANNARRRAITARYRQGLAGAGFPGVEVPFLKPAGESSCHIFPILLPPGLDRQVFMEAMRARGVQTSIHYPPIHQFSYYRRHHPDVSLPVTEAVAAREVTLPLYPGMKDSDVDYVIQSAKEALAVAQSQGARPVPDGA
jgi:dTDP-4-amino-4,6-dideoxygalactose transaminase